MFFEWKKKEQKYYQLEELKVGMRVHVRSLDAIYQEAIYLERKSFKHDSYGGEGTIVAIGLKDAIAKDLKRDEVYVISNAYDLTDETISEDPAEETFFGEGDDIEEY